MIIENSIDNKKIIKINHNGKNVYLGSKYNMQREILNFDKKFSSINKKYGIIVFGACGGVWIEDLIDKFREKYILFIEPLEILKLELEKTFENLNLDINILSLEDKNFEEKLKKSIKKRFTEMIIFSNYDLIFPKEVYKLKKQIRDYVIDKTISENTAITFSKDWFMNYLSNLNSIMNSENLNQYKNNYSNKPAIIVSAGPSLEKNFKLLKGNEDKFIIITGIRTLNTLRKEGINVDFACVIDGSEDMYKVSKPSLKYNTSLFFSEGVNKKIINEYIGNKIYFTSPSFYNLNKQLDIMCTDLLNQGGSVAHSCTAIAHYLGCNPIIFIGQDLAYTNNKLHAENAIIDGENLNTTDYDILVKDINGKDVPTSYSLDSFRKSFEQFINVTPNIKYINATEGGANINGTEIQTLKSVIEKFKIKIDKNIINKESKKYINIKSVLENLKFNLKEIIKAEKLANKAIIENKNLLNRFLINKREYKKSLDRLDYIDDKFRKKQNELLLINSLFAPIIKEIDIIFYDEKIDDFNNEIENIRFISDKGKMLYENINESINFAIPYIENIIKQLEVLMNESE